MNLYCGREKGILVLEERDIEIDRMKEAGCGCNVDIIYVPCKYRGKDIKETLEIISSYNEEMRCGLISALKADGRFEFY